TPWGAVPAVVSVASPSDIVVDCSDPLVCARLEELLHALVEQRTPRFFDEGDGQFPVTFAAQTADADGRAIDVHGTAAVLRYWIDTAIRVRRIERIASGRRGATGFGGIAPGQPGPVPPPRPTNSAVGMTSEECVS